MALTPNSTDSVESSFAEVVGLIEQARQRAYQAVKWVAATLRSGAELAQRAAVQVALGMAGRQVEELDRVGILESASGGGAMHLCQRCRHFCRAQRYQDNRAQIKQQRWQQAATRE